MGSGHAQGLGADQDLRLAAVPRVVVIVLIVVVTSGALFGVLRLWPEHARVVHAQGSIPIAAKGIVEVHGELVSVRTACTAPGTPRGCADSRVRILDGRSAGRTEPVSLTADVVGTGLRPGDHVLLLDSSAQTGGQGDAFTFYRDDRGGSLLWLVILFAVLVVLVAVRRGLFALVSLGFAGVVVIGFLIPAMLSGRAPVPVALVASVLILVVMLYVTHGISMRTSVALLGALIGLGLSAVFAWFGVIGARLGGLGDESAGLLTFNVSWVDVQQLVVASVVLAGLGTLNDVTVTQTSAIWELRAAAPTMTRPALFRSAMRIGRDHVASTVYTLVFAYLGTSLVLLVAIQLYRGTVVDFATAENVAEEIVRALVGGIALVLAMPITTLIGTLVVGAATPIAASPDAASPASGEPRSLRRPPARRSSWTEEPFRRFPDHPWDEH